MVDKPNHIVYNSIMEVRKMSFILVLLLVGLVYDSWEENAETVKNLLDF